jgi:DNA-binding SARP family transcriptional activator
VLALAAGRPVSRDELIVALWAGQPPTGAVNVIQTHIKHLRHSLDPARAAHQASTVLPRTGDGYALRMDSGDIDVGRFRHLLSAARLARLDGNHDRVASMAGEALTISRSRAAADIPLLIDHPGIATVAEERGMAAVWFAEAAIGRGMASEAVAAIEEAAAARALDESTHAWLIRVYYAVGRRADALAAYGRIRRRLAEDLGLDPAPQLRALQEAVLRDDPALGCTQATPQAGPPSRLPAGAPAQTSDARPRCLPRDLVDFTGRAEILRRLLDAIPAEGQPVAAPVILAIDGMPGVGKTALAVHAARLVADRYPAAQLHLDLLGHSTHAPLDTAGALDTLLRQLGVPGEHIPDRLEDRIARWRSELAGRRTLLLLDNAATMEQIAALLPADPDCLTLVTSRRRLAGLDGAQPFSLEPFTSEEAVALQERIVGARVRTHPHAAQEVALCCGHLALAIRLAAARLAHRPGWSVPDLAARLRRARTPLRELALQGRTVEAAFALSYQQLSTAAQRLFRLLSVQPGPDIDLAAAAAVADLELDDADNLLTDLVDGHLVEEQVAGRYRLHDLLRDYAHDLFSIQESAPERQAATGRLLDLYLHTAVAAAGFLDFFAGQPFDYELAEAPRQACPPTSLGAALAWLDTERRNLVAVIQLAAEEGWHRHVWRLTRATWRDLYNHGYDDACIETHRLAIEAAHRSGEPHGVAVSHNDIAAMHFRRGRLDEALRHVDQAIAIRGELGDWALQATSLINRGFVLHHGGRYHEAIDAMHTALQLRLEHCGDNGEEILTSYAEIGKVYAYMGNYAAAETNLRRHLALAEIHDSDYLRLRYYAQLGDLRVRQGRYAEAVELNSHARHLWSTDADPPNRADTILRLGAAYRGLGRIHDALRCHQEALTIMEESRSIFGECDARIELGITLHASGDPSGALREYRQALSITEQLDLKLQTAQAMDGIAAVLTDEDPTQAQDLQNRATALYTQLGLQRPKCDPPTLTAVLSTAV